MAKIFRVQVSGYDAYDAWYVEGPDGVGEEEFRTLCRSLVPEAARRVLANGGRPPDWNPLPGILCHVSWDGIAETLAKNVLPEHGYRRTDVAAFVVSDDGVRESPYNTDAERAQLEWLGDARAAVLEHNRRAEGESTDRLRDYQEKIMPGPEGGAGG